MINSIKESLSNGKPTIAECGGFMYLHNRLTKKDGLSYEMVGAIDGNCYQTSKLQRFGYITLNSEKDNLITKKGEKIKAHEFHYWESSNCGNDFTAEKNDGRSWKCCHANNIIYAGFPHINFYSNLNIPASFIRKCLEFGETNV